MRFHFFFRCMGELLKPILNMSEIRRFIYSPSLIPLPNVCVYKIFNIGYDMCHLC